MKDSTGYVLKTYVNGSNLKLYLSPTDEDSKNDDGKNSDSPDLVLAQNLPEEPHSVNELLKSIQYEKKRPKSRGMKREIHDVDMLFPGPESYRKPKKVKKDSIESASEIGDRSADKIPPSKVQEKWNSSQLKIIKPMQQHDTVRNPMKSSLPLTPRKNKCEGKNIKENSSDVQILKKEKDIFLNEMVASVTEVESSNNEDNDDVEIVEGKSTDFFFNPLTKQQRVNICKQTSLIYRKDIENTCIGEKLGKRNPAVKFIKGDGNCFFHRLSVSVTGWEVGHLAVCKLICDHINTVGPYTKHVEGKTYLNQSKMKTPSVFATDVEIMAAAQVFGTDIYIYHTYGNSLKWLHFPCVHTSSNGAIYLNN